MKGGGVIKDDGKDKKRKREKKGKEKERKRKRTETERVSAGGRVTTFLNLGWSKQ